MSWESLRPHIHQKWKQYWYETHPPDVGTETWEYLFTGGKEIRARLFCELWSYLSPADPPSGELAFAIECIHTASLILDDTPWMDNAPTRRGRVTLHLRYSNKKALLLFQDVMYMVYLIWKDNQPTHLTLPEWEQIFLDPLQRLVVGQAYDLEKTGTLFDLASMKTGVLFELVTKTVAVCTRLDVNAWQTWGNHLGILFQWMDDWQDREEDIVQHNRNAFNEAYDDTLAMYGMIWRKVEQVVGPSWFERPFGQYMRQYFTMNISLPPMISSTLSNMMLPYSTPPLPTLPSMEHDPKHVLESMISDPNRVILLGNRNVLDLTKQEIEQHLRNKAPLDLTIHGRTDLYLDWEDLFHVHLMNWIHSFNESNIMKIDGKQLIRIMIQLVKRFQQTPSHEIESYRQRYEVWRQKIWMIDEREWEYQSEVIDFIYDEIHTRY